MCKFATSFLICRIRLSVAFPVGSPTIRQSYCSKARQNLLLCLYFQSAREILFQLKQFRLCLNSAFPPFCFVKIVLFVPAPSSTSSNIRRSSGQYPAQSGKCVKPSLSVGNLGNGAPLPSNRSVSLTADHIDSNENSSRIFKRSQSTKKREGKL